MNEATRDVQPNFKQPRPEKAPRKALKRTGRVKPQRGGSAASLKRKATTLHSQYVRARAGRCERCNKTDGQLQCAHVMSRRYAATRTDEWNAWCLCAGCHRFLTENPFEHVLFAAATRGERGYMELREKAYSGVGNVMGAAFWQAEVTRLTEKLRRLP